MRKINYYENVLEFKSNTHSNLLQSEVNNWQLCRTCLSDADADSSDLHKLCIMGMDGNFLNVHEMLTMVTGLQFKPSDKLPPKICNECLNKLSTYYYFKQQTRRAEDILKRLLAKLDEAEDTVSESVTDGGHAKNVVKSEVHATSTTVEHEEDCSTTSDKNTEDEEEEEDEENAAPPTAEGAPKEATVSNKFEYTDTESEDRELTSKEEQMLSAIDSGNNQDVLELDATTYIVRKMDGDIEVEFNIKDVADEIVTDDTLRAEPVDESMEEEYYLENEDESNNSVDGEEVIVLNVDDEDNLENVEILQENDDSASTTAKLGMIDDDIDSKSVNSDYFAEEPKKKNKKMANHLLENLNCNLCGMVFYKQCLLVAHVQDSHPGTKAFKCRQCGTMFTHLQSLSRHMITHKTVQFRNVCDLCGKAFLRSDDWKRHIRVHTGERPYVCGTCGKAFKQTNELKEHKITHDKLKLFECNICGHRMASRNGLYIHRKAHTGIKNHVCPQCFKRFLTNGELKSHMNVHLKKGRMEE